MKKEIKRYLLTIITCFILMTRIPTMAVYAAETSEESSDPAKVLEYVLESGDKEYLSDHQDLFPSSMVSELLNANPDNWEKMLKDEDAKVNSSSNTTSKGCLTKSSGTYQGPSGKETYYNLNMSGVVSVMRNAGYSEEDYPYWVRDDGVKMLGDYVMVAAAFSIRPRGTVVETSLGDGIVCDTGSFAYSNQTQLDIAVNW